MDDSSSTLNERSEAAATGPRAGAEADYRYWAFISYSHADERWAGWLHRSIEGYKVPKAVAGTMGADGQTPRPPRLFPVFRDRDELSSAASLGERIEGALAASRNLVVICSPNAVRSRWVNEEIRRFKALGREGRVFCLIVDGEPNATDVAGSGLQECFPDAVRFIVGDGGRITSTRAEPLAADARAEKDGKRNALLKLLAGLLEVGFDTLKQRDHERRMRTFKIATTLLTGLVVMLAGLTYYALVQKQAAEREARAARASLSGQVATHAQSSLETFPRRSLLLAAQALRITEDRHEPTVPAAKEALYHALTGTGGAVFGSYDSPVVAAGLSPDNRWLVAVPERGGSARLWDLNAPHEARKVFELPGAAGAVAFSGDGRWLVTAGPEQEPARLWDLTSPDPGATARVLEASASPFRFSPDHRWLVTGGAQRSVRLWDLTAAPETAAVVLPPHIADKLGVAISRDGRWLVTHGSYRGMLLPNVDAPRLYDLAAPRPETTSVELAGHTSSVTTAVFSLDGRWLATGSAEKGTGRVLRADNNVRLWDLAKPRPAAIELRGHEGPITAMAMSGDGRWLVTGSADHSARVWSLAGAAAGTAVATLSGHEGPVTGTVITAEGTRDLTVATITQRPASARVWSVPQNGTGAEATVMSHNGRPIGASTFQTSHDGRRLLVGDANTVLVIDLTVNPTPRPIALHAHEGNIATAVFARDGRSVATGGQDGTVRLWTLEPSPSALPVVTPAQADERFAVSPDDRWLVTIGADTAENQSNSVAALRDLAAADIGARLRLLRGHTGPIFSFAFSGDSRWLATGGHDRTARLWDLRAAGPRAVPIVLSGHDGPVSALAFTTDGRWLVTGSFDATLRRWDLTRANPAEAAQMVRGDGAVFRLAITTDGRWAIARGDRRATLWDLKAADPAQALALLRDADADALLLADDRWLVTHGSDERQSLREQAGQAKDSRQHQDLQQKLGHVASVTAVLDLTAKDPLATRRALDGAGAPVGASRDGRWLVTQGLDGTPLLWPVTSNGPVAPAVRLKEHSKSVTSVAFGPDGRWLVTGGYDETVRRWDLKAKDVGASAHLLASLPFAAYVAAFSEDGRRVLASGSNAAYLWELGENDAWPPPILLPGEIGGGGFSGNGRWLITRSHDTGTVGVWSLKPDELLSLACRTAARNLTEAEWDKYFPGQAYSKTCPDQP